jgi:polysaccharide export outer membrane protein
MNDIKIDVTCCKNRTVVREVGRGGRKMAIGWIVLMLVTTAWIVPAQSPTPPRPVAPVAEEGADLGGRSTPPESPIASGTAAQAARMLPSNYGDYLLAPSDVIEVQIEDAPELSGNYRVNQQGRIPMKFLGSIPVAGLTTEEVTSTISEGLRGRYLRNPQVYVSVRQYNSRTFFIQGAVKSPGVYVIEDRPSLFKLITVAGGLVERHAPTAFIIRETRPSPERLERSQAGLPPDDLSTQNSSAPGGLPPKLSQYVEQARARTAGVIGDTEYELITAQISGLFRGSFDQNVIIQPNDLVYIPPAEVFFVAGEVKAPGQFPLREGTTLRQAISLAQGTLFNAASGRGLIFRQDPLTGKLNELAVDVAAVMNGKQDDVSIMPNDVIMIPHSRLKSFGGAMGRTLGMGMTQALLWTLLR